MLLEEELRALTRFVETCPTIHCSPALHDGWVDEGPRSYWLASTRSTLVSRSRSARRPSTTSSGSRAEARLAQQERNAAYCSEWLNARVAPTGVKGYAILIEREDWSIKVAYDNPTRPPIFVELRSLALHTHPEKVLGACEDACAFIRDVLLADRSEAVREQICLGNEKLSRLDLHIDYQGGWHPDLSEQERRQFIKPGHAKLNGHLDGDRCTGYDLGKRRIVARIYNKTIQAKEHHLDWYFTLLEQQAGDRYDPEQDVWRLEFELKREGIQGFCLYSKPEETDPDDVIDAELEAEDLPTIGTIQKALYWAPHLMQYLMTRWFRLVVPGEDTNRARWATHPTWLALKEGFAAAMMTPALSEEQDLLVRTQRHTGYSRLINRMAVGIASAAEMLLDTDPASVLPAFVANVEQLAAQIVAKQEQKRQQVNGEAPLDAQRRRYFQGVRHLSTMALGVLTQAGVLKAELPPVHCVGDLLAVLEHDLDQIANSKGGIGQVLYDKWCKTYWVVPPPGMFTVLGSWQRASAA